MLDFLHVVSDQTSPCSYLADQSARLPMCLPVQSVTRERFDEAMEAGYRRSGAYFYNTQCPNCSACQPIRLDVNRFQPSRTHRRILRRASELRVELGDPMVDDRRVELFNLHRQGRGLARDESDIIDEDYASFLLSAPNPSVELSIWHEESLVSVSITDIGRNCLSAVYCCFDPRYSQYSLGTLSVLKQVEVARSLKMDWLYLGFYVRDNTHLCYKANYLPHERRIDGVWTAFQ